MAMQSWQKATLLLCLYGFFKEMKPSEPFLTPYLKSPQYKNLSEEQLDNQVYPVWTYSYLVTLFFVFLFTDFLRYKPVIIIEGFAYVATRVLLIWAFGVFAMQMMQFVYGVATGAEIAYYSYIYTVVQPEHFRKVTGFTRAAVLVGKMMCGIVGQLLVSLNVAGYLTLNYISLGSVCIALVIAFVLPSVGGNVFGISSRTATEGVNGSPRDGNYEDGNHSDSNQGDGHQGYSSIEPSRQPSFCVTCFTSWKQSLLCILRDMKECYSNKELLKWSLWWAFGTCGEFQVENYASNLWDVIYPSRLHRKVYNGAVTALSHLVCTGIALLLGYWKINWSVFGELCLGIVSISDSIVLYISAWTSSIWLAYLMYLLFRVAYTFLIVIASFQIAKNVSMTRYALIFGCNMFTALLLQTILTSIVVDERGLGLDVITQFVVYGSYFYLLGALFLAKAIYTMTKKGWRNCWKDRYAHNDSTLPEQTTDGQVTNPQSSEMPQVEHGNIVV